MKRFWLIVVCVSLLGGTSMPAAAAQQPNAPQVASYQMRVQLDPAAKTIAGSEQITYRNPSEDTLNEIWLRLYLKAFSSRDTLWMRESGGSMRGMAMDANALGDITVHTLTLADGTDLLATSTLTDTLLHVQMPQPLAPGQTLTLNAEWTSKLPRVFARTGYGGRNDTFFMVGQWYPKMAVYDRGQWDTEPWHANAEFFNDFGSYDVSITLPQNYMVAGAGVPAGEQTSGSSKTVRFTSDNVTDFAFAASPDFQTRTSKAGNIDVALFYLPEHASGTDEYMRAATGSVQAFSEWYGLYPHPRLTVVDVPDDAAGAGGMEYPTLVTGGTLGAPINSGTLSLVTAHEIGHQWWPMQTATNEAREPWLDEGLTEYSGLRYMAEAGQGIGVQGAASISAQATDRMQYAAQPALSATMPSWQYSSGDYAASVYGKTALALWTLENRVGTERLRRAMADYLAAYRFKHPTGADFRASFERSLGADAQWFFRFMDGDATIDYGVGGITNAADGSHVTINQVGGAVVPVDVLITLASGTQQTKQWDGSAPSVRYDFAAADPAVRVEIDPAHKLVAELDLLNNQASTQVQAAPALTLGGRLAFWFQIIAQSLGMFG